MSSPWDGSTGQPSGPPEWPKRGGIFRQPAKLVEAVTILRTEWGFIETPMTPKPRLPRR